MAQARKRHELLSSSVGVLSATIATYLVATAIGCGGSKVITADLDPNLVLLTKLYVDHLNANQGMPPRDRQQFEEFIRAHGSQRIGDRAAENLEKLFISTRDGQPLVIFYGKISDPQLQGSVVGHEEVGIDGKRCVGMRYGTVQLVDQKEFEQLVPNSLAESSTK